MTYKLHLPNDSTRNPYRVHHDAKKEKQYQCLMCKEITVAMDKPRVCPKCGIAKVVEIK